MTINKSVNFNVLTGENFSRGQKVKVGDELHPSFSQEGRIINISPNQAICVEFLADSESAKRIWFHSNQITNQNPLSSAAKGNV